MINPRGPISWEFIFCKIPLLLTCCSGTPSQQPPIPTNLQRQDVCMVYFHTISAEGWANAMDNPLMVLPVLQPPNFRSGS